jgi:CheY-like chemotaxis protein
MTAKVNTRPRPEEEELRLLGPQQVVVPPPQRTRILVCDDQEALVEVLSKMLVEAGYEVRSTLNSLEAIEIAYGFQPEVALIGEIMPRIDGFQLALELTKFLPKTKIVLTAEAQPSDLEKFHQRGWSYDILPTPFTKDELLERMSVWVGEARSPHMEDRCYLCKMYEGPFVTSEKIHRHGKPQNIVAHQRCLDLWYCKMQRGPRKGQWVRKTRRELRADRAVQRKIEEEENRRKLYEYEAQKKLQKPQPFDIEKQAQAWGQFLGLYLLVCLPYAILILIANFLNAHQLGWVFFVILAIDLIGGRMYRRPKNLGKHFPLFWIFR